MTQRPSRQSTPIAVMAQGMMQAVDGSADGFNRIAQCKAVSTFTHAFQRFAPVDQHRGPDHPRPPFDAMGQVVQLCKIALTLQLG